METIVKVEQQQQHGGDSKPATCKLIAVDPEALNCPRCPHPLQPLVYQCTAGHMVCISCLQSMRLACPNGIHRCSSAGKVAKMGPCGGGGGDVWEMDMNGVSGSIRMLHLSHDIMVDAMMVLYEHDDGMMQIKLWGSPQASNFSVICLQQHEYLTGMKGHIGDCKGWLRIKSLTFISNLRTFGPYGTEDGTPFELPAVSGRIMASTGAPVPSLDAIGTYVKMDA